MSSSLASRLILLLMVSVAVVGCADRLPSAPTSARQAPAAAELAELPKFGTERYWGGHEIPPNIIEQRQKTFAALQERGTSSEAFALELTQLGWQAITTADFATAIRRFNQAWLIYPETPFAVMGMAVVVFERDGDTRGGLTLMRTLQDSLGHEPDYWSNLASMERRVGENDQAFNHFQNALLLQGDHRFSMLALIEMYAARNNIDAACALMTKAHRLEIPVAEELAAGIEARAGRPCRL